MADMETVITHLQIIHTWAEFARERDLNFFTKKHLEDIAKWSDDALELLKENGKQTEYDPEMPCNKKGCDAQTRASCCGCPEQLEYERNKKKKG